MFSKDFMGFQGVFYGFQERFRKFSWLFYGKFKRFQLLLGVFRAVSEVFPGGSMRFQNVLKSPLTPKNTLKPLELPLKLHPPNIL